MQLVLKKVGDLNIINVHNDIFQRRFVDELRDMINDLISENAQTILVNFSRLESINQVGLGVLLCVQKISLFHDVTIRFYGFQPQVMETLTQTGISKVLDICEPESECNIQDAMIA